MHLLNSIICLPLSTLRNMSEKPPVIHLVQYGLVACAMEMPPKVWPEGHKWSSDLDDVTCAHCRENATLTPLTFELIEDGKAIKCRLCGSISYSKGDIDHQFCGWCKTDHGNLWPPARKMMLDNPAAYGIKPWPGASHERAKTSHTT